MGHYAEECWFGKRKNLNDREEEAKIAQEISGSDLDPFVFMATTDVEISNS